MSRRPTGHGREFRARAESRGEPGHDPGKPGRDPGIPGYALFLIPHSSIILDLSEPVVITLYLQHEFPGEGREANWLPAPEGPFAATMRLYWPGAEAVNGAWQLTPLRRVDNC